MQTKPNSSRKTLRVAQVLGFVSLIRENAQSNN